MRGEPFETIALHERVRRHTMGRLNWEIRRERGEKNAEKRGNVLRPFRLMFCNLFVHGKKRDEDKDSDARS